MKFLWIILGVVIGMSCTSMTQLRKFSKRTYRPCKDNLVKDPVGKFCFRYCSRYRVFGRGDSRKCKYWVTDVKDFSDPKVFYAFRAGDFVLINDNRVH